MTGGGGRPHRIAGAGDTAKSTGAAQTGDPALFAAEKRCSELRDQIAAFSRAHGPETIEVERREIEPLDDARVAAERLIFATEPETLAGAAVKLWLLAHPDRGIDATEEEITALRQVLAFVEASAIAGPVTGDRRILGLFHQWAEAWRHCRAIEAHVTDDEIGEAVGEARRFEDAIAETDAATAAHSRARAPHSRRRVAM